MNWRARKGAAFLVPSGPNHDPGRKHLHMVLTDPSPNGGVLVVSLCSVPVTGYFDSACLLSPGDHEFIIKKSFVNYRFCEIYSALKIEGAVKDGQFEPMRALSSKCLGQVLDGLVSSKCVAPKFRKFFESLS